MGRRPSCPCKLKAWRRTLGCLKCSAAVRWMGFVDQVPTISGYKGTYGDLSVSAFLNFRSANHTDRTVRFRKPAFRSTLCSRRPTQSARASLIQKRLESKHDGPL